MKPNKDFFIECNEGGMMSPPEFERTFVINVRTDNVFELIGLLVLGISVSLLKWIAY